MEVEDTSKVKTTAVQTSNGMNREGRKYRLAGKYNQFSYVDPKTVPVGPEF